MCEARTCKVKYVSISILLLSFSVRIGSIGLYVGQVGGDALVHGEHVRLGAGEHLAQLLGEEDEWVIGNRGE